MSKKIVIKGDIIKSKSFNNFKELFEQKLSKINYPNQVIKKFEIIKGDEIQGIFNEKLNLIKFLRELRAALLPLKIRIAVLVTEIDDHKLTDFQTELLEEAEKLLNFISDNQQFKTYISTDNELINKSLNTAFLLVDKIKFDWSVEECELYHNYAQSKNIENLELKSDFKKSQLEDLIEKLAFNELYITEHNLIQIFNTYVEN